MPRLDPTFSGADIIRIWQNNLTLSEQERVLCFLCGLKEQKDAGRERAQNLVLDLVTIGISFVPLIGGPVAGIIDSIQLTAELVDVVGQLTSDVAPCALKITQNPIFSEFVPLLEDLR